MTTDRFFHNSPGIRIAGALLIFTEYFNRVYIWVGTQKTALSVLPDLRCLLIYSPGSPSIRFIASFNVIILASSRELIDEHSCSSRSK